MREYELMYIVHPDLDDNAFKELVQRVASWITESGGAILNTDIWGKRELAYPIRKQKQGQYVLVRCQLAPQACLGLERNLRLQESILRFLLCAK